MIYLKYSSISFAVRALVYEHLLGTDGYLPRIVRYAFVEHLEVGASRLVR